MKQIIYFLLRNKNFLLFLFLFLLSIFINYRSNSYTNSKIINSSNEFLGFIYNNTADIKNYFNLVNENEKLINENKFLRSIIINSKIDTITDSVNYDITSAHVIKNSFRLTRNYITLDVGKKIGIKEDLGVISSKGILIGSIKSFKLDNSQNYLELEVLLFNDMSNINNVYIIENKAIDEIKSLDE